MGEKRITRKNINGPLWNPVLHPAHTYYFPYGHHLSTQGIRCSAIPGLHNTNYSVSHGVESLPPCFQSGCRHCWSHLTYSKAIHKCPWAKHWVPSSSKLLTLFINTLFPRLRQFCLQFHIWIFLSCSDELCCQNFQGKTKISYGKGPS